MTAKIPHHGHERPRRFHLLMRRVPSCRVASPFAQEEIMSRRRMIPAAIVGGLALLSTPAMAQYASEVDDGVVIETQPLLQPYTGAPLVEERVYETRRVIDRPTIVERRVVEQPTVVERRVYRAPRAVDPPALVSERRTYGVRAVIDEGSVSQCRIVLRRWTNEFGETMERRARVCD
jgi:hypothetical protein